MILRTRFLLSNAASPTSPLPALLLTMVRSRAPCSISASISCDGIPAVPNPPIITVAPSGMSTTAAAGVATVLSIIDPPFALCAIIALPVRSTNKCYDAAHRTSMGGYRNKGRLSPNWYDWGIQTFRSIPMAKPVPSRSRAVREPSRKRVDTGIVAPNPRHVTPASEIDVLTGDPNFMTSLARGIAVIRGFTQQRRHLTIAQLSQRTALPRAAVRRCLYPLAT